MSVTVSRLNDEKVVKPPRKPTVRSSRAGSASVKPVFSIRKTSEPMMKPMSRLPSVLTNSVPNGKYVPKSAPMCVVLK